jgi:hypothetical protein
MKTIAQQLKIKDFPFFINDKNGNEIYREDSNGYWCKWEWDDNGNEIYREDSEGYWSKSEWDDNGNEIYYENSDGYWFKREWDDNGNEIYYENSDGQLVIIDNRPKVVELTLQQIAYILGIKVEQLRIKD